MPTGKPAGRPKGQAKTGGRKRGTQNKNTALLKDAVLRAAEIQGSNLSKDKRYSGLDKYLVWLSAEHPVAFTSLLSKVLPLQIGGNTDDGDGINNQINFADPPKVIEHQPRFVDPDRPAGQR
jgi:hypothetical protein